MDLSGLPSKGQRLKTPIPDKKSSFELSAQTTQETPKAYSLLLLPAVDPKMEGQSLLVKTPCT